MLIPSASIASSDDEALRGLLLSTLTALMKASKTNSIAPIQFLFRERLKERKDRRELNRALFAMTTALSRKKPGGSEVNIVKAGVYDSVKSIPQREVSLEDLARFIETIDYSKADIEAIESIGQSIITKVQRLRDVQRSHERMVSRNSR